MKPIILVLSAGAAAAAVAAARTLLLSPPTDLRLPEGFTLTAHSGSMGLPDNSIEAMAAGVAAGADTVEFDLRYDQDGRPVLSHDAPGRDAVPLTEVFAFLRAHPDVRANVDVKDTSRLETVEPLADEYGVTDRLFYTGIGENDVSAVRKKSPRIPYYLNAEPPKTLFSKKACVALAEKTAALGAAGINLHHSFVTPTLVKVFHANGLPVSAWTVNERADIARMLRAAPDNITTRKPDLVRAMIEEARL